MGRKHKTSPGALLEELQSQENNNSHHETEEIDVETRSPDLSNDGNTTLSLNAMQNTQEENDALLVKIIDTNTEEITTKKMKANEVWHMAKNLKVMVELNADGHGNDNGTNLLVRFLGKLARNPNLCPIHLERWSLVPKAKKVQLWKLIEDNFLFDYVAGCSWVMTTLGERLREHKYHLRCNYFYHFNSMEELLATPSPNVDISDWSIFVRHYHTEKMKNISSQNTSNRKKLKVSHAGGSKSNAR
ncbi:uncharacterized protein G2W53_033262 [Senna tora]|uniref:Transposase n=1 Tax=Senna tora TaxID=362788 RepID=A0A834WAU6_9FABA|nr:uncharacterized protein G2W53_033262 [Senna tora]